MTRLAAVLLLALAAAAACDPREPPAAGDHAGSPAGRSAAAPSSPAPLAPAGNEGPGYNMTGLRPHRSENCPSSLPGATTRVVDTPRGVEVTVTSRDAATAHRIVELAQLHVRGRAGKQPRPHDQQHGGPGWIGYCPVMLTDQTRVSMTPRPDGATLHVEARSPALVAEIQALIRARAVRLPGYLSS